MGQTLIVHVGSVTDSLVNASTLLRHAGALPASRRPNCRRSPGWPAVPARGCVLRCCMVTQWRVHTVQWMVLPPRGPGGPPGRRGGGTRRPRARHPSLGALAGTRRGQSWFIIHPKSNCGDLGFHLKHLKCLNCFEVPPRTSGFRFLIPIHMIVWFWGPGCSKIPEEFWGLRGLFQSSTEGFDRKTPDPT